MALGNPVLNEGTLRELSRENTGERMSVAGALNKTGLLLAMLMVTATYVWMKFSQAIASSAGEVPQVGFLMSCLWGGMIGGMVFALITIFAKRAAFITAPCYALCEGLVLGGISAIFNTQYRGIVFQAVALTTLVSVTMLALYRFRIIRVTERLKMCIVGATAAVALLYLISMILSLFHVNVPLINSSGVFGIIFSLIVVGIASFNLLLDFDYIEMGVQQGAPKYLEWFAGFGVLVTLVWLYLEMLRLLSKLRER